MTYYYFSKADLGYEKVIIVFEQGCLGKPVCILNANDIQRLSKEWLKETENSKQLEAGK